MTSHPLLVLVFAVSCFSLSSCNHGVASVPFTYPARVLNTTQTECPSDDQRETVRAEVGQDLRNILQSYLGISCPNLTNPENGQVVQALNGNVPGTVANYSCDACHMLLGNVSSECVSTGLEAVWTAEAPACQRIVSPDLTNPEICQQYEIRSFNLPSYWVALTGNEVYIKQEIKKWKIINGICGIMGTYTFQSVEDSNAYLRHYSWLLYQEPFSDTNLFRADACFYPRVDKFFPGTIAFESVNHPNRYIRHYTGFRVRISLFEDTDVFKKDSSFIVE